MRALVLSFKMTWHSFSLVFPIRGFFFVGFNEAKSGVFIYVLWIMWELLRSLALHQLEWEC